MPSLRLATLKDAVELSRLAERCFRETFAEGNSKENMDKFCRSTYSESLQLAELSNPRLTCFICADKDELIGFAQILQEHRTESVKALRPCEIQRFYVLRPWHGSGIAHALMHTLINAATSSGCDALWLGVWEQNPRAISFYRKHGFIEAGSHTFLLGTDPQRDLIFYRQLETKPSGNTDLPGCQ